CTDGAGPQFGVIADSSGDLYGTTGSGGIACGEYSEGCGVVFKLAPDGTQTVLYSFCNQSHCTDGARPTGVLIADPSGNLFGTTAQGGGTRCSGYGCGTVFKLAPDGTETVLYAFKGGEKDGALPN